ncbi:N-6 DNA methylase [Halorubrum sp. JWXQ-INN 858]|uniref:N-6 DNA methylase n=1 Tax=Halorubrum sp. JWXQ-INN 858 TaxID=2690782 RepID=UPI001358291C|nr:N-6 DNA methylase [Halorubrum sp. JWXQ-INN 858]MWV65024.1 N-6 DNA methylase [Halorubrum sp. JWXQ-INN 858]
MTDARTDATADDAVRLAATLADRIHEGLVRPYAERVTAMLADGSDERRGGDGAGEHGAARRGVENTGAGPDPKLRAAADDWAAFVREAHGDVFSRIDAAPDEAFVHALAYDFAVARLLDRVETALRVRIRNREATANTDVFPLEFDPLHEHVASGGALGSREAFGSTDALEPVGSLRTAVDGGFLRALYERTVDRSVRLALGQYYTPRGLASVAVDALPVADHASDRVLDPGCGSGVFLDASLRAKRAAIEEPPSPPGSGDPAALVATLTDTVVGFDINPVAVRSAKLRYALSIADLLAADGVEAVELPVFLTDSVGLAGGIDAEAGSGIRFGDGRLDPTADHLVGNPPWITWANLPESTREAWRDAHVDRLGLLAHEGAASLLGHANDDVSVPFVWVCIDRYLAAGGSASVVLKRGLTKGPSGRLFRAGDVGDRPVAVERVQDLTRLDPFGGDVTPDASVYTLRADRDTTFPVDATSWSRGGSDQGPSFASARAMSRTLTREGTAYRPIDGDDPAGSWIRADADRRALGECAVPIRHGVKDDAAAVFDVDEATLDAIEADRVFPYLKSRHVVKYGLFGHDRRLVPMDEAHADNEAALAASCPATYDYLRERREELAARSSSWLDHGPFYNVFGLGEYTWSPYKVVWCRLAFKPHFVVVSTVTDEALGEKPVVPGDHCMFVPTDDREEAHFLCALLNSASYRRAIEGVTGGGKSGLSKAVVSELALPRYPDTDEARRLAELSMRAHRIVPEHVDVSKREYNRTTIAELEPIQAAIDRLVEGLLAAGCLPTDSSSIDDSPTDDPSIDDSPTDDPSIDDSPTDD